MSINKEELSAFVDGELADAEAERLFEHLMRDETLRKDWSRLHATAYLLHSRQSATLASAGFADRVAAAIELEPTILAPAALAPKHAPLPLWGKVGAVAVAASVGAISFLLLQPQDTATTPFTTSVSAPVAGPVRLPDGISPAAVNDISTYGARQWSPLQLQPENSLEAYLAQQRALEAHLQQSRNKPVAAAEAVQ